MTTPFTLHRDAHGMLWLEPGHLRVKLRRTFPLSDEGRMISVRDASDGDEKEVWCITDTALLDAASRQAAEAELRVRYFVPRILRVLELEELFGFLYFTVETDRGRRSFVVKDASTGFTRMGVDGVLVLDAEECRYVIPSVRALDAGSRALVDQQLFLTV